MIAIGSAESENVDHETGARLSPQPPSASTSDLSDLGRVIRGGTMQTQSLLLAIDKAERQLGRPGISVHADNLPTVAELLVRLGPSSSAAPPHSMAAHGQIPG
jgi:hypothetical protein